MRGPELAARKRLQRFAARLERAPIDEIRMLGARPLEPESHDLARADAEAAARAAGLGDLVAEAQDAMTTWLSRWLGDQYSEPSLYGLPWQRDSLGPEDRARVVVSLRDATLALVAADLVREETFDELLGPFAELAG